MTYIKILVLLLSFVGYVTYISKRAELSLIQAPFLFCCFISIFLYAFAIAGALVLGTYLALALGLCLFVLSICKKWLSRHTFQNFDFSYLIFIAPYCVLFFAIAPEFKFLGWDEFSFWASSQKLIFGTGELYKEHSPIFLKSYPPGQQLLQYYLTKLTFWSEKNVLFAQIFWVLSGLMCVAGTLIKRPIHAAITFLTSCAFLYYFNFSFSTLYSDPLLGVCFAVCVAFAFTYKSGFISSFALFLSLATLVLIKEIGIFLALVALAIAFISRCLDTESTDTALPKKIFYAAISTLTLTAGLFAVSKTWTWYLGTINSIRPISVPGLADFSVSPLRERTAQTMAEFWARLLKPGYIPVADTPLAVSPSVLTFFLGMIILSVLLVVISRKYYRLKAGFTTVILAGGAFAYVAVLIFSFLVLFTEYEGVRLASFERYLSTYTFAWFLVLYTLLSAEIFRRKLKYALPLQLVCISLIIYFVPKLYFQEVRNIQSVGPVNDLRVSVDQFALMVKKHIAKDEKVYFIAQNTNGLERAVFTYAMLPFTSSMEWCWSLGQKYFEGDVWTCNTSLESVLKGYTYLALYSADEQFWKNNGAFFDPSVIGAKSGVFKINRQANGAIQSFSKLD
jgi:hypothetical protein